MPDQGSTDARVDRRSAEAQRRATQAQERATEAFDRSRLARERGEQLAQRLDKLKRDESSSPHARGAAELARRAVGAADVAEELATQGFEHAAKALELSAQAHEHMADLLQRWAETAVDDRAGDLHERARGHRAAAAADRQEAGVDRDIAQKQREQS